MCSVSITLREYQRVILNNLWKELKTNNRVLVCSPTGSGKTVMASALIYKLIELGHKVAFVVDSEDLIRQTQRTLDMDVSIVKAGYEKDFDKDCPIQIIMLQTFFARNKYIMSNRKSSKDIWQRIMLDLTEYKKEVFCENSKI